MKIKTSDLTGTALDWAVAKCEGIDLFETEGWVYMDGTRAVFRPSTDWRQGGLIIEKNKIDLACIAGGEWVATGYRYDDPVDKYGPTPLVAAMRAHVASKSGDEIDVPEILT